MSPPRAASPVVLALDTSTATLSAAVCRGGTVHERHVAAGRHTGALVPGAVTDVLAEAGCEATELTVIAVGAGPGPYTSLRAGIMFAEAAGVALGIPVVGACSLDITARGHSDAGSSEEQVPPEAAGGAGAFVVAADARRRELYWARYDHTGRRVAGPQVGQRHVLEGLWAENGDRVVTAEPTAAALARWVVEDYQQHGGAVPPLAPIPVQWAAPSGDAAGVAVPQSLLVPRPLYLRRPDAVEPNAAPPVIGAPT